MKENMRIKACPHRHRANIALRGVREPDCWINFCGIQERSLAAHEGAPTDVYCNFHGNAKIISCKYYNNWRDLKVKGK